MTVLPPNKYCQSCLAAVWPGLLQFIPTIPNKSEWRKVSFSSVHPHGTPTWLEQRLMLPLHVVIREVQMPPDPSLSEVEPLPLWTACTQRCWSIVSLSGAAALPDRIPLARWWERGGCKMAAGRLERAPAALGCCPLPAPWGTAAGSCAAGAPGGAAAPGARRAHVGSNSSISESGKLIAVAWILPTCTYRWIVAEFSDAVTTVCVDRCGIVWNYTHAFAFLSLHYFFFELWNLSRAFHVSHCCNFAQKEKKEKNVFSLCKAFPALHSRWCIRSTPWHTNKSTQLQIKSCLGKRCSSLKKFVVPVLPHSVLFVTVGFVMLPYYHVHVTVSFQFSLIGV